MSTIRCETAWKLADAAARTARRSRAYSSAPLELALHRPDGAGEDAARAPSSIDELKTAMPPPGFPSSCSAGTSQSSRKSSLIGDVRRPIFESGWPDGQPGRVALDEERAQPGEARELRSVVAKTRNRSATGALVTNVFEPLST